MFAILKMTKWGWAVLEDGFETQEKARTRVRHLKKLTGAKYRTATKGSRYYNAALMRGPHAV